MKKILAASALCLASILPAVSQDKEELTVPLSNPGKPYKLKVVLTTGSIKVTGVAGARELVISANSEEGDRQKPKEKEGMKRISTQGGIDITAKESNNSVTVFTSNPMRALHLDLKIPQDVTLQLSTVNGGDIIVENVTGELEVSNVNGDIRLNGISGSAVANTVNGDVVVKFKAVNGNTPMAFSTLNGDVNITYPATARYNLKLKSDRGEVYSDFDIEVDKSKPRVNKTSNGGMYRINTEDWIYGKINGGGPEVMMKSMMGDILVRKAK